MSATIEERVASIFTTVGARGLVHVREIGTSHEVGVGADEPVVLASVVKIIVALAFAREVSSGAIALVERAEVPARYRIGGAGTAGCRYPVEMSLCDLALFMMSMSDNAATDVIYQRTGQDAIDSVLEDLRLVQTHVRGDMESVTMSVVSELDLENAIDIDDKIERAPDDAVRNLSSLDPSRASASTPREVGRLLEAIWTDAAGPADACALTRALMSEQIATHRLASGFDQDGIQIASKTGTLPGIRNESGVVTYPDQRRYVAAVFTQAALLSPRHPRIDRAIGQAALISIDYLRAREATDLE